MAGSWRLQNDTAIYEFTERCTTLDRQGLDERDPNTFGNAAGGWDTGSVRRFHGTRLSRRWRLEGKIFRSFPKRMNQFVSDYRNPITCSPFFLVSVYIVQKSTLFSLRSCSKYLWKIDIPWRKLNAAISTWKMNLISSFFLSTIYILCLQFVNVNKKTFIYLFFFRRRIREKLVEEHRPDRSGTWSNSHLFSPLFKTRYHQNKSRKKVF